MRNFSVNESLKAKLLSSEKFQVSAIESFKQLEEKLENHTNRQLRKAIIFKDIPKIQDTYGMDPE